MENNLENIAKRNDFNPIMIGIEVLKTLGYKVNISGFGYNSMSLWVYDPNGKLVYSENIGE
jgi:hypothetical protein